MKVNTNLTKVIKKEHEGKWVALNNSQTRVVDYAERLRDLSARVGQNNQNVVFMRALRSDTEYAF